MSDLIYRQAAIDAAIEAVDDWDGGTNIGRQKRIEKAIKALPSAQPGWIPCKTRKPEKSGLYLVTKQQKTGEIQLATAHYNTAFDEWSGNGRDSGVSAGERKAA